MRDIEYLNDVRVYIEGLLVQTKTLGDVIVWSGGFGLDHIAEEMHASFYKHLHTNVNEPWAYHLKHTNGYVLLKPTLDESGTKSIMIVVNINETDKSAPTLSVSCEFHSHIQHVEIVASLVALAQYYAIDSEFTGESNEQ